MVRATRNALATEEYALPVFNRYSCAYWDQGYVYEQKLIRRL